MSALRSALADSCAAGFQAQRFHGAVNDQCRGQRGLILNNRSCSRRGMEHLLAEAAHPQQITLAVGSGSKRCRDDAALHGTSFRMSFSPRHVPLSNPRFDELYQHCLQQTERLLHPQTVRYLPNPAVARHGESGSPTSVLNCYGFVPGMVPPESPTYTTPPPSSIPQIPPTRPQLVSCGPGWFKDSMQPSAYLQVASPAKRRRVSWEPSHTRSWPSSREPLSRSTDLDDALLRWSHELARGALHSTSDSRYPYLTEQPNAEPHLAQRPHHHRSPSSSPQLRGYLVSDSSSGTSDILHCLQRWSEAVDLTGDTTVLLAFHLWSRVAAQQSRSSWARVAAHNYPCRLLMGGIEVAGAPVGSAFGHRTRRRCENQPETAQPRGNDSNVMGRLGSSKQMGKDF